MGQRVRMDLRAFILRLREDWIYWRVVISSFSDSLIFQSCRFCSRFFWMAILKSERFFSWVNRRSGKGLGSSIDVLHEAFKIAHIYTFFGEKFYRFEAVFCIMILWFCPICAYYAERKFCHRYTRALSPVWNRPPIYTHYMREKFRPRYIWEIAVRSESVRDWLSVGIFAFVCIMFLYMRSSFG